MATTTKVFDALTEAFDAPVVTREITPVTELSSQLVVPPNNLDNDAESVRDTLYNLLKVGTEAFDDLKRIAVAEESPRSFEVLNGMLANLSDIAVKLIDIQDKVNKIKRADQKDKGPVNNGTVNNNTVFVGTTTDLQDMLRQLNMENDSD